ncbi:MAG: hypothetical protein HY067_09630 [Betaproteobacteria bacterium]|nr:hypothetical protein [Betaproteobacteria bacterium]
MQTLVNEVEQLREVVLEKNREALRIGAELQRKISKLHLQFAADEAAAKGESIDAGDDCGSDICIKQETKE